MTPADLPPHDTIMLGMGKLYTERTLKLAVRQALERAAVCAWSTGMDEYAGTLGLSDARETGSKCATAIRAIIKEYSDE